MEIVMKHIIIFLVIQYFSQAEFAFADTTVRNTATFVIQHRGVEGEKGKFFVRTSDIAVIQKARKELAKPETDRQLFVNGKLAYGDANINYPWHWHIIDDKWDLTEKSIEVCDGTPEMVEQDTREWVENVKRFCPWKSYVFEEKREQ